MHVNEKQMHCWKGYKKKGTKKLPSGKVVNNCVKESTFEGLVNLILEEDLKKTFLVSHYGMGISQKTTAKDKNQAMRNVYFRLVNDGKLTRADFYKFKDATVKEIN
jgi:hypothetical protein